MEGLCRGKLEAPFLHLQRGTKLHKGQIRGDVRAAHLPNTSPQIYRYSNLLSSKNATFCNLYVLSSNFISAAKICVRNKYSH